MKPFVALFALALVALPAGLATGCGDALADAAAGVERIPGPVTAGPQEALAVPAGVEVPLTLELATDLDAVDASKGFVVLDGPTLISGRVETVRGPVGARLQLGRLDDGAVAAWRTIAEVQAPDLPAVLVDPLPGEVARLALISTVGAEVAGGDSPRRSYLTAIPLPLRVEPDR